jgi:dolichyl-phosphate-mannose--protein O-mannosyl transferase
MSKALHRALPALVIASALFLSMAGGWNNVLVVDEVAHLGAGYSYLIKRDMRLNPEHPPLVKDLAALPLMFLDLKDLSFRSRHWRAGYPDQYQFGRQLVYRSGNDAVTITRAAHFGVLPIFALAAVLLYAWARRLHGETSALIALALFCFSPTSLAHGHLVATDMAAAMGALLSVTTHLSYLRRPTPRHLLLAGVSFGVALLAKFSLVLLVPFLLVVSGSWALLAPRREGRPARRVARDIARTLLVFAIGFVAIVWPIESFQSWNYEPQRRLADLQYQIDTDWLLHRWSVTTAGKTFIVLFDHPLAHGALEYCLGVLMVAGTYAKGHPVFWLGEVVTRAGPLYFPIVYLLKEPMAWWALAALAAIAAVWRAARRSDGPRAVIAQTAGAWMKNHFDEITAIGWITLYWATSLRSGLTIGVRHLLPAYPFTILLVVGALSRFYRTIQPHEPHLRRAATTIIALLVTVYLAEVALAFPHYLAFFNAAAGGSRQGHRYVADSNLDWGQDLARLCDYVQSQEIPRIEVDYFGWADVAYFCGARAIPGNETNYANAEDFLRRNKSQGWLAVSATHRHYRYMGLAGPASYEWLADYAPVTVIGHSIFVYHLTPFASAK